ncbi:MAG: efflux RND transporter periplasmic adaptor subunit [Candidatus Omnitrophota bacterium]|nr:efflux RND transporter periplasmic adaptor subunit [Candidatus Omnitrophota bacterium]
MKKKKRLLIILGILAVVAGAVAAYLIIRDGAIKKPIKVSGNIEGDDVRISFRVEGQITELLTDEGMVVKKNDIVARLNKDELSKVKAEAEAALKLARYQYKLDRDDYVRAENLLKAGAISAQQRDAAKTKASTDLANIKQLRASLELANTKLGWTDLASPLDGYVLVKSSLPGEVVQPGTPVFTAVNLDDIWVTAYLAETDLGRVKLGQKAYVATDSYKGKKYDGWISFISSQTEFTPKYIQTTEERVKYVYRIKVRVDNSSLDLKPGMPADAYITVE